ncbi:3-isopropylmalate dehydratase small subunit [Planococcus dechangensis]|uniref:3-isopropylmalate dehydratase small subunit n=1 Tax=Planococcus dechangensis TaxID=1176255 RepID=A0ABV9MDT0_9BACL
MKALKTHTGTVMPLDRANIDTDAIIPKQFLKRIEKSGYGQYLFYDWRFKDGGEENNDFVLNQQPYRDATVMLTRDNFGCGSSREHAPWSIEDYGFRIIIAPSFADIFYNNCFKNGILPIRLPKEDVQELFDKAAADSKYELTVDLEGQEIHDSQGMKKAFDVDEYRKHMLLEGMDEISATVQHVKQIDEFERQHRLHYTL